MSISTMANMGTIPKIRMQQRAVIVTKRRLQTEKNITIKIIGTENLDQRFSVPDRFLTMMFYVMAFAICMCCMMFGAISLAVLFFGMILMMVSTISTFPGWLVSAAAVMSAAVAALVAIAALIAITA